MNILRADSYKELEELIHNLDYPQSQLHFRGQSCIDYELQSRITAKFKDDNIIKTKASEIMNRFKTYVIKYNLTDKLFINKERNYRYFDEYYWLFQAQHIGVPTILMDWSFSWKRALYFAVEGKTQINSSGQLWVLFWADNSKMFVDPDPINDFLEHQNPFAINKYGILNPYYDIDQQSTSFIGERRRFSQAGEFFAVPEKDYITPLEKRSELSKLLTLIEITTNLKKEILEHSANGDLEKIIEDNVIEYEKYSNGFIYGKIDDKLLEIVNYIREEYDFPKLS
jgi:hypothetical protein